MLSTSWTGDQLLVKGTQLWNDWPIESLGQVILVAFTTWITCKMHFTWRSVVQKDSTSLPLFINFFVGVHVDDYKGVVRIHTNTIYREKNKQTKTMD